MPFRIRDRLTRLRGFVHHGRIAAMFYKKVLDNANGRKVDGRLRKRMKDYCHDKLGDSSYWPWLRVYTAFRGEFLEGWIPRDYLKDNIHRINTRQRSIGEAKTQTQRFLRTDALPDVAYHVNGEWLSLDHKPIDLEKLEATISQAGNEFVLKYDDANRGRGVTRLQLAEVRSLFGGHMGDAVLQRSIRQAAELERLSPGSVATLRVLTAKPDKGPPRTVASYLRVGRKGENVIASKTALKVGVVDSLGTMDDFGVNDDWMIFRKHPDTGLEFGKGERIPLFREAKALCESLHERNRQFSLIGWDVGIDEATGVNILEWNTELPAIPFVEAVLGPCFKDITFGRSGLLKR